MNLPKTVTGAVGARLVAFAFTMFAGILVARILGPEDRGIYQVLTNIVVILSALSYLGIGTSNLYYAAQRHSVSSLVANSLAFGVGIAILFTASFLLLFHFTQDRLFPGVTMLLAVVAVASLLPAFLYNALSSIVLGLSRIRAVNLLSVASAIILLAAVVATAALLKLGILELLIITLVLGVLSAVVLMFLLNQTPMTRITLSLDWALMHRMVRFSGVAYGANLASMLAVRSDVLLLNILVGGAAVGHFAVAVTIAHVILLIPQSVQQVLFVQFSSSNVEDANRLIPLASRTILALMSGLALVAALLAVPAVRLLFGVEYGPSATLLILLLPGVIAWSLAGVFSSYFTGRGRPDVPLRVALAVLVVVISLDFALMPLIGAKGAALAASAAKITGAAIMLALVLGWSETSLRDALWPKREDLRYFRSQLFARQT